MCTLPFQLLSKKNTEEKQGVMPKVDEQKIYTRTGGLMVNGELS